ncbi:MAG: class I SAM-dependent methyltransferase [Reyranella sp.]|nr:class I SAM-dependent methyltransferase [Reyranella sp.]
MAEINLAYETAYASGAQIEKYVDPVWANKALNPYHLAILKAVRDHKVSGVVVDCGAGWGGLVEMLLAEGLDARGVELSREQVAYAEKRRWPIVQGSLSALEELDGKVSAVTLNAVLEHLVNHSCVLSDAHRLLKEDGLLITLHPTAAFFHLVGLALRLGRTGKQLPGFAGAFAAPWHTALLSIEATKRLFADNGFDLVSISAAPQGKAGGITGALQWVLGTINSIGWPLLGTRWPLVTSHVFVFQKRPPARQNRIQHSCQPLSIFNEIPAR